MQFILWKGILAMTIFRSSFTAAALILGITSSSADVEPTWTGRSAGDFGEAEYTTRCGYECAENYSLVIKCDKARGMAELTVFADSPFRSEEKIRVLFIVDGVKFNVEGRLMKADCLVQSRPFPSA